MRTVEEMYDQFREFAKDLYSQAFEDGKNNEPAFEDGLNESIDMFLAGFFTDRLREICEAERSGRCVVMPCKVGDTVYVISYCENIMMICDDDYETGTGALECPFEKDCNFENCDDANKMIYETTCTGFFIDDDRKDVFFDHINAEFYFSDFGKTVFLSRAEAEAALKEGEAK